MFRVEISRNVCQIKGFFSNLGFLIHQIALEEGVPSTFVGITKTRAFAHKSQ